MDIKAYIVVFLSVKNVVVLKGTPQFNHLMVIDTEYGWPHGLKMQECKTKNGLFFLNPSPAMDPVILHLLQRCGFDFAYSLLSSTFHMTGTSIRAISEENVRLYLCISVYPVIIDLFNGLE